MNIKTKLILGIGMLAGMIILLVTLSVVNLQILTATEPDSPAATPGLERALLWISVTGGICILTGLILLYWLPRTISKPIKELKEGILEIANHNYEKRLQMNNNEEFRDVADSFNRMAERLTEYRASTLTELYAALAGVFDGITIVLNPVTVSVTPFQGIREPIAIGVYRNGNPLRNIRLKAEFVSGAGDLSSMSPTNESGVAALYVRNITSKQAQQEIGISLIDDVFSLFRKGSYAALFKQMLSSLPGATLTINTVQTQTSAYVRSAQSDIEAVERTVKSLLNNHFFNVVASPSEADIIVTLDNKCRKGNTVPGELYNFIEFFSTLGIKIENNRTGQILLNYSINDERTLVPENKSASQGKNMAARELIKRLNREFARELKKITFDRTGKIPERQKMLPDVPVPIVGASVPEKEADPVISVPVVVPEVIPAPLVPVKSAKPENQKAIRVEWLDGVFVEFDKLATLGDKSRIHLKIVNTNADDCEVDLYSGNLTVINEKGEESPIVSVKLGSKFNDRRVTALIVPDLPTEMVIEVSKLQSMALLQLKDFKNNIVKLRGLK